MDLSVVICSLDRRASLLATLAGLARQEGLETASRAWDVLVVDNGSADGSLEAVCELARQYPVSLEVIREPRRGLARARNTGLERARGEVVLFLDDDVIASPRLVEAHLARFADPGVVGTGGRINPVLPRDLPPWWRELIEHEIGGPTARYDFGDQVVEVGARSGRPAPFGANMTVRREEVLALGGFRTDLGWGPRLIPGEESELYRRLQAGGGRLLYVPEAAVDHVIAAGKLTRDYFVRWYRGHGRATVLIAPPQSRRERACRVLGELRRTMAWQLRLLTRRASANGAAHGFALRKLAKAQGKLLQLLGL